MRVLAVSSFSEPRRLIWFERAVRPLAERELREGAREVRETCGFKGASSPLPELIGFASDGAEARALFEGERGELALALYEQGEVSEVECLGSANELLEEAFKRRFGAEASALEAVKGAQGAAAFSGGSLLLAVPAQSVSWFDHYIAVLELRGGTPELTRAVPVQKHGAFTVIERNGSQLILSVRAELLAKQSGELMGLALRAVAVDRGEAREFGRLFALNSEINADCDERIESIDVNVRYAAVIGDELTLIGLAPNALIAFGLDEGLSEVRSAAIARSALGSVLTTRERSIGATTHELFIGAVSEKGPLKSGLTIVNGRGFPAE